MLTQYIYLPFSWKNFFQKSISHNLLIFKTDIKTKKKVKIVGSIFNNNPMINKWNIDLDDIDNVLRIEAVGELKELDLIKLIRAHGFYCETLPD